MTPETWITLAMANFVASVAPGQNVALVGASTARAGSAGGLLAVLGILLAELSWSILALFMALGARGVDPALMLALQLASGSVLIVSGLKVLRAVPAEARHAADGPCSAIRIVANGVWIGAANPMALVFFLSLFPGFVAAGAETVVLSDLVLFYGSAVVASAAAGLMPYLVVSNALVRFGLARLLGYASGAALLVVGLSAMALGVL
ncbi:LysE family transporter [Rhodobacter sp. NTK016B]|uniref:LysE family translocator n=1 Tax=Rhodobacter sp. NTK016B TaxID=2759676 RepID=UPI001A8CFE36|nr:LysE family transporter [Rhodobacter sp. NTK016B]MBN8293356.1 LysE family transporter [Rhodobacter sp. NTK016B]